MTAVLPGFADPVADAQGTFRAVLDAMGSPGRLVRAGAGLVPPAPVCPAAGAVLLTLLDSETPIWFDTHLDAAREWVAFHCGAPAAAAEHARFGACLGLPPLRPFDAGTDEAPEAGITLIVQVAQLGAGVRFCLRGPGIRGTAWLEVDGLPASFVEDWRANRVRFPRGIDVLLCAGETLAALPRSVDVAPEGTEAGAAEVGV